MSFIIVGYYTADTLYEDKAKVFAASLDKYNVPYYLERIKSLGDWYKNTCYKPTFLRRMLEKFSDTNIVYVDCDAKFLAYPVLFDTLDCDVGVYVFDRSCYSKSVHGFEVLSGTIFLKNNVKVKRIVGKWALECKNNPRVWDQKSLEKTLNGDYYTLPGEYCKIFDRMPEITNPIIVHYQASREVRANKGRLGKKQNRMR